MSDMCWFWLIFFCFFCSCSVPVSSVPIGGSRADGTVTVAYEYGPFAIPEVNREEMYRQAKERCQRWGYQEAERFGGGTRQCIRPDGSACWLWRVSIQYQCHTTEAP